MYDILIVGGGYIGAQVAAHFCAAKQRVTVIKRTDSRKEFFDEIGAQLMTVDLRNPEAIPKIPKAHFILIALAPDERTDSDYEQTYVRAVQNFLNAYSASPRPLFLIYISSTGVYGSKQAGNLDEDVLPQPESTRGKILLEAERQILSSPYPSAIFRLAGIYGPGRNRIEQVRSQTWGPSHPDKLMHMIHAADIIQAIALLYKRAQPGRIYLGADDEPVLESEFYPWLAKRLGVPCPADFIVREKVLERRYTNIGLKTLGFQFSYPNFKVGYTELLESEKSAL